MKSDGFKSRATCIFILLTGLLPLGGGPIALGKTVTAHKAATEATPGQSLGIASVPNLRGLGGYTTSDGKTVARALVYQQEALRNLYLRSN